MSRSPFAYPLTRNIDGDAGGAADLQTDIMRFMAILSLCLMAIFALVQSIPLAPAIPEEAIESEFEVAPPQPVVAVTKPQAEPKAAQKPAERKPVLTRPKWTPKSTPQAKPESAAPSPVAAPRVEAEMQAAAAPLEAPAEPPAKPVQPEGFTLRFESDQALMRLVAASEVGLYAIVDDRAQRMTVNASRISFWDASTPNSFHEMETRTVPDSVINALARSETTTESIAWGVTLPGSLRKQLDELMRNNTGGSLVIGADGQMRLETS